MTNTGAKNRARKKARNKASKKVRKQARTQATTDIISENDTVPHPEASMKGWRNTNRELQRLEQQRIAHKHHADYLMECCENKTAEPSSTKKTIEVLFEKMAKINEAILCCGHPVEAREYKDCYASNRLLDMF